MRKHALFFIVMSLLAITLYPLGSIKNLELIGALGLFFGLGIPHGALDLSLGKILFQPKFGSSWWLFFIFIYLVTMGFIICGWLLFPFPSFLFFLLISVIHFGFSDTFKTTGLFYYLEGFLRGCLPISLTGALHPDSFQRLVESSLNSNEAHLIQQLTASLFYPTIVLLFMLVAKDVYKRNFINASELLCLLILFTSLNPFPAFLIYFCFLHSLRHILHVMEEMHLPLNLKSWGWIILQAFPSTFFTMIGLLVCYLIFKEGNLDLTFMFNLFFISLAALTFPHMILVELIKRKPPLISRGQ